MEDKGHNLLMQDISDINFDVRTFQFHDFKNDKYPTPKIALIERLQTIINKTKDGMYDN